ncbi:hypothetical protein CBL_10560 [Carabus blaptoides fortunei]
MDKWLNSNRKDKNCGDTAADSSLAGFSSQRMAVNSTRKIKYDDSLLAFGFSCVIRNGVEQPICLISNEILAAENMKPSKLNDILVPSMKRSLHEELLFCRPLGARTREGIYLKDDEFFTNEGLQWANWCMYRRYWGNDGDEDNDNNQKGQFEDIGLVNEELNNKAQLVSPTENQLNNSRRGRKKENKDEVIRKRKRNPSNWARNVRKLAKTQGKEFTSVSGRKIVAAKKMNAACTCRKKGFEKFTQDERQILFTSFYKLSSSGQNQLVTNSIEEKKHVLRLRRDDGKMTRRKFTRKYFLTQTNGDNRILIFGDPNLVTGLRGSNVWIGIPDGTLKIVPSLFFQLYTIHFQFDGGCNPVGLYCLLPDKSLATYNRLFDEVARTNKYRALKERFSRAKRSGIHSVVRYGEAASSNKDAAEKFVGEFKIFVEHEAFSPNQVFNCDESGLFWKKMPSRTYITKEEKSLPGHKPMIDRLTLLLCANASEYLKIKPLLVYHSENPRVFKQNHVIKSNLGVMWRANPKAWVTRQFFTEWMYEVFAPSVKTYLEQKNLPLKALLVLGNAPAHPPDLEEDLTGEYSFIQVRFLPPNTTPLIQPMDQQVISNFKKLYTKALFQRCFEVTSDTELTFRDFWKNHFNILHCLRIIDKAWDEVSLRTLKSSRRNLGPDCVVLKDLENTATEAVVVNEIVSLAKSMGLDVDSDDVEELIKDHRNELTTEELQELQREQQEVIEDVSSEEDFY